MRPIFYANYEKRAYIHLRTKKGVIVMAVTNTRVDSDLIVSVKTGTKTSGQTRLETLDSQS